MEVEEYFEYVQHTSDHIDYWKEKIFYDNVPGLGAIGWSAGSFATIETIPSEFYRENISPILSIFHKRKGKDKVRGVFLRTVYEALYKEYPWNRYKKGLKPIDANRPPPFEYEVCGLTGKRNLINNIPKCPPEEIVQYCACAELLLDHMYYFNQIFDEKGGCVDVVNNSVAGILVYNAIIHFLHNDTAFKGDLATWERNKHRVFNEFTTTINNFTYLGQWFDSKKCVYDGNEHLTLEQMLDLTMERITNINAVFYESLVNIAGFVAGIPEYVPKIRASPKVDLNLKSDYDFESLPILGIRPSPRKHIERDYTDHDIERLSILREFGLCFGKAQQIVNDMADFIPPKDDGGVETTEKTSKDSYKDIMAGKLTPPVIYGLHMAGRSDKEHIITALRKGKSASLDELVEVTKILVSCGAMQECKKLARRFIGKESAVRAKLRKAFSEEERAVLGSMCVMVDSNRFYKALEKLDNE